MQNSSATGASKLRPRFGVRRRRAAFRVLAVLLVDQTPMGILIDEKKRGLVRGITGREGRARTRLMRE